MVRIREIEYLKFEVQINTESKPTRHHDKQPAATTILKSSRKLRETEREQQDRKNTLKEVKEKYQLWRSKDLLWKK